MTFSLYKKHSAPDTTIFTHMSQLAQTHQAINLAQGFPDFPLDNRLGSLLQEAVIQGYNQYAPMIGLYDLRCAISKYFEKKYHLIVNEDTEISICPGATYAIYVALSALLQVGDEAIILEPAYDSYIPNIELNGAIPVPVKLDPTSFLPDWEAIKKAITPKTKVIIVNTPHNPTGTVWSAEDVANLADLVKDTAITIVSDEVYESLVFDQVLHQPLLQHQALRERTIAVYSFGKTFHNTGWKIGFCVAAPALTQAFRKIHQYIAFSVNSCSQYALAQYMIEKKYHWDAASILQHKRDYFLEQLKDTPLIALSPARASYFQLVSYQGLSELPDKAFAEWLTTHIGVASIPISAFYQSAYDQKILRFCFAKQTATLDAAITRLKNF